MAMRRDQPNSLIVRPGQRLSMIHDEEDGVEITRVFVEGNDTDPTHRITDDKIASARSVIGLFDDLDWGETVEALDRIRHESRPTPPIDDL